MEKRNSCSEDYSQGEVNYDGSQEPVEATLLPLYIAKRKHGKPGKPSKEAHARRCRRYREKNRGKMRAYWREYRSRRSKESGPQ